MARSMTRKGSDALANVRTSTVTVASGVGGLWIVHAVNVMLHGSLLAFGIHPRTVEGLLGILAAPFLHVSAAHLAMNTISFVLLGGILLLRNRADFFTVSAMGALGSGLGAWALGGPGTVHVGLSGVLFSYLGFLMARGIFERSIGAILLSGGVTYLFGSMAWGVLPLAPGVSWQAHLFGFLTGLLAAGTIKVQTARRQRRRR